jgi:hypothetical protein
LSALRGYFERPCWRRIAPDRGDADHQAAGHGTSSRRPKAIIRIPSLQLELPLAEIYAGIETG